MQPGEHRDLDRAGLCAHCGHCRRIGNARGSVFLLCGRAESEPTYARYPRLPVTECPGFAPTAQSNSSDAKV